MGKGLISTQLTSNYFPPFSLQSYVNVISNCGICTSFQDELQLMHKLKLVLCATN